MMRSLSICLMLLVSACVHAPMRIESRALADHVSRSPDHFIIAAVVNEPKAFVAKAGGTPHGYDGIAGYGPTSAARYLMTAVERDYGLREVTAWPIQPLHVHCALLEIPDGVEREQLIAKMARDKRVKLVEPLQTFATRTEKYNDPYVGLQHGLEQMDIAGAHVLSRGEGVRVAIIDTGADVEHVDLRANVAAAINFVDTDSRQFARDRHGTEVAGVIAAIANNRQGIVGVAPGARLMLFKACWQKRPDDDAAVCNTFTLAQALVAALDAHAQVVNLSVAGPADPLLAGLIREGIRRGVLFVAAADRSAPSGTRGLSNEAGVIEVSGNANRMAADSSVIAPGQEILTLLPGGHYDFASGDSIATAQVSGVLALLLEKNATLSAANAYQLLRDTSTHSDAAQGRGETIDACAALIALVGHGNCAESKLRTAGSQRR